MRVFTGNFLMIQVSHCEPWAFDVHFSAECAHGTILQK